MPIWNGAVAVVYERSSDGNTAKVLGEGGATLATCSDDGLVKDATGATLMTMSLSWPRGQRSRGTEAVIEVAGPEGASLGALEVRRYKATPFSKSFVIGIGPSGELATTDKKAKEMALTVDGATVATLALADRDRGLSRTVERWSLQTQARPASPADLLGAAAVLQFNRLFAEVGAQASR